MKYLSLVIVIAFICFTFWFSKQSEELTIDQMNKINNLITAYMTQAVQNNQPNASEIEFSKIYTEVIESGKKMKAHFKFSYLEPNGDGEMEKVYRRGTFLITSEDGDKWTAQIENAGDVKVEFMEPFDINEAGEVKDVPEGGSAVETATPEESDVEEDSVEESESNTEETSIDDEEVE